MCVSVSECVSFDFSVFSLPYLLLLLIPTYIPVRENGCEFECVWKYGIWEDWGKS